MRVLSLCHCSKYTAESFRLVLITLSIKKDSFGNYEELRNLSDRSRSGRPLKLAERYSALTIELNAIQGNS
ncbi:hypothetical protein ILUMI_17672, partial [Ignelater luminosus]